MNILNIFVFLCGFGSMTYFFDNYFRTIRNHDNQISNYKTELYYRFQYEDHLEHELDVCNYLLKKNT